MAGSLQDIVPQEIRGGYRMRMGLKAYITLWDSLNRFAPEKREEKYGEYKRVKRSCGEEFYSVS